MVKVLVWRKTIWSSRVTLHIFSVSKKPGIPEYLERPENWLFMLQTSRHWIWKFLKNTLNNKPVNRVATWSVKIRKSQEKLRKMTKIRWKWGFLKKSQESFFLIFRFCQFKFTKLLIFKSLQMVRIS